MIFFKFFVSKEFKQKMQIIPTIFTGSEKYGDFEYMIMSGEYNDSLFIFNDNEEYHFSDKEGCGNAIIRKFNKNSMLAIPRSAGIPTGTLKNGGYKNLGNHEKDVINFSVDEIKELIRKYKYSKIYFSADSRGRIGTSLFQIHDDVKDYITVEINKLGKM